MKQRRREVPQSGSTPGKRVNSKVTGACSESLTVWERPSVRFSGCIHAQLTGSPVDSALNGQGCLCFRQQERGVGHEVWGGSPGVHLCTRLFSSSSGTSVACGLGPHPRGNMAQPQARGHLHAGRQRRDERAKGCDS